MQNQKDNLIAKKYAEALVEIREGETVIDDLNLIRDCLHESVELSNFLANPEHSISVKKAVVLKVFKDKVQKEVLNTLLVLLDKRRIGLAPLLAANYKQVYFQRANIELTKISSATVLEDSELQEIRAQLEAGLKKKIEIHSEVDESLIAGVRIQMSNKVIDSSLKAKLKNLKALLLN